RRRSVGGAYSERICRREENLSAAALGAAHRRGGETRHQQGDERGRRQRFAVSGADVYAAGHRRQARILMLRMVALGSGSRGNALLVEFGDTLLLVDCGLPRRDVEERLKAVGRVPSD